MILFDPDHLEDPYPRNRHWREHHPIWFDAGNDSWVLSRHGDVLRVFKDHEAFSSSGLAEGPAAAVRLPLLNDDPPRHTQLRALVSRAFTSRALRHMEGRVESLANDLAAALPPGQPVDVAERLTIPLPIIIIGDTMAILPSWKRRWRRPCAMMRQCGTWSARRCVTWSFTARP